MRYYHWQNTDCGNLSTKLPESNRLNFQGVTYSEKKNSTIFINFTRIKQTSLLNINNVHEKYS